MIGKVEVVSAHEEGEVVSASEESRTRQGKWLKR